MNDAQHAAALELFRVLSLMPCACSMYEQWRKELDTTFEPKLCMRCKAIAGWNAANKQSGVAA